MVLRGTLGEYFCPIPSPNGAAPHARGTLLPLSVAQQCITARSGNTSTRFRHPRVPRRTPGEHFCHYPSPDGVSQHARGTFLNLSVARWCITTRLGDTYARFRRPRVPRRTLGKHFGHYPPPNGAAPHARATLRPVSVAGEGGGRETDGEGGPGDRREAGQGRSLGRSLGR